MKDKLLVIAPKVPDYADNKRDKRFFCMVRSLAERFEVHFLFIQSMFARPESIEKMRDAGVKVMSFQEIKKKELLTIEDQLKHLFGSERYAAVLFKTYFTAKYYLPYLSAYSPESFTVIDIGKSQYLLETGFAAGTDDVYKKANMLKSAEINRMKEIPIYSHADMVIVDSAKDCPALTADVPRVDVRVVGEFTDEESCVSVGEQTVAAFTGLRKNDADRSDSPLGAVVVRGGGITDGSDGSGDGALPWPDVSTVTVTDDDGRTPVELYNEGLRRATGDHVLLMREGTVVTEQALRTMLFCARSNPFNGIVVPASNVSLPGLANEENLSRFIPKHYIANFGNWHEVKRSSETCMLISRGLIDRVCLFDDRFATLPGALMDYFLRGSQLGYRMVCPNEAFVYHRESADVPKDLLEKDHRLILSKWCDEGTEFLESLSL